MTALLAGGAIWSAVRGIWPVTRLKTLRMRQASIALDVLVWCTLGGCILFMAASSVLLLVVVSTAAGVGLMSVGAVVNILLLSGLRKRPNAVKLRLSLFVVWSLAALLNMPLCAWMWAPPDAPVCESPAAHDAITRMTPQSLTDNLSAPYALLWVPSEQKLFASFKMAGNLTVWAWDDPRANRLQVFDLNPARPPQTADLPLPEAPLPQYMAFNPDTQEVAISRLGYEDNLIDFVSVQGFPTLERTRSIPVDFSAHDLILSDDLQWLTVFSHFREAHVHAIASMHPVLSTQIETSLFSPGPFVTGASSIPNSTWALVSLFGTGLASFDTTTGAVRIADVGFGAGEVTADPEHSLAYQGDFVFGAINVVDTESMTLQRRLELDFKPRPIIVDIARNLLLVGDWFGGNVHFYDRATLAPVRAPLYVGPYLRDLALAEGRDLLFVANKCGIYQVDLNRVLAGGEP